MICAITGGTLVDGSGGEPFKGDVIIKDGVIAEIIRRSSGGFAGNANAASYASEVKIINASGKAVTPGFVDIHRHCDLAMLTDNFGAAELAQGITSVVIGNCGLSSVPYNPQHREVYSALLSPLMGAPGRFFGDNNGVVINPWAAQASRSSSRVGRSGANFPNAGSLHVSHPPAIRPRIDRLIGSCSVRIAVKGMEPSPFTRREMDTAVGYIREAMDSGALGRSFGLLYYPEYYSPRDELVTLAKAASAKGGVLTCHIRGEGDSVADSVREITDIAERAEIPLQINHFKACGVNNWGVKIHEAIEIIEERQARGADIGVDVYPYDGGATTLMSLFPPGFMKATVAESVKLMESPAGAGLLEEALSKPIPGWDNYIESLGFGRIIISSAGKSVEQILSERPGLNPYKFLCGLMAENNCEVGVTVMSMSQKDVDTVAKLPYASFISDALYPGGGVTGGNGGAVHPRAYGAFPKVLRDMVRERKILSLQEAVKKMTSAPANRMKLKKRGLLKEGYAGGICVFDPNEVRDNAAWENPTALAEGINVI